MTRSFIAALALAASALATPALAAASLDAGAGPKLDIVAKADLAAPLDSSIDQASTDDANVDHDVAGLLDITAYRFDNDLTDVAPIMLDRQASFGSFNAAPAPVMQYAVLVRTSADYLGSDLDPAMRAKRIV